MSKKLDLDNVVPASQVQAAPVLIVKEKVEPALSEREVFPNVALSIVHAGANNYKLLEIRFNVVTGDTSAIKEIASRHTREEIIEQFKMMVVRKGLMGGKEQ